MSDVDGCEQLQMIHGSHSESVLANDEKWYKVGTQFGTQKCAEPAVEAVDAVSAVRIFLSKNSAC
jgi:hypothetical protein